MTFPAVAFLPHSFFPIPCKVPFFNPGHEMAAKRLSVWFLLSADPISKRPEDPALGLALLLCSPNSPQTSSYWKEGNRQRERVGAFFYSIRRQTRLKDHPSHSAELLHTERKKKQYIKRLVKMSFILWITVLPSLWGRLLRTMACIFGFLLWRCCESERVGHQRVLLLEANNNYYQLLQYEHTLSNVCRWTSDCIVQDSSLWSVVLRLLRPTQM